MTINGMLSDIGFVSLLQYPNSSSKTGLLTITAVDGKAEFYYRKGKLIHAKFGRKTGREVLVDIMNWNDGQFSFKASVEPEEETINDDLHHILMWALKKKNERKKQKQGEADSPLKLDSELSGKLEGLLKLTSDIEYISLISTSGQVIARTTPDSSFLKYIEPFMVPINDFIAEYPGKIVGKAFVEAADISIAISGLDEKMTVVIATGHEIGLDRLTMVLKKTAGELAGE